MKILLIAIVGLGALLLVTGGVNFSVVWGQDIWGQTGDAAAASPVVKDLLALQDASVSTNVPAARHRVLTLIRRASAMESHAGARVLRRSLPMAASVAADEFAHGREAVAAAPIRTEAGSTCREAVLRLGSRSETLYRNLAEDVAVMRETWRAVRRFGVGANAALRSYSSDLQQCVAGAPPADRGSVERLMVGA
jgi:hypothetical protein